MKPGAIITGRIAKTATATHSAATVTTETPGAQQRVYLIGLHFSYSVAQTTAPLATVTDGTNTLENYHVYTVRDVVAEKPIAITKGKAAVINLPDGGSAVVGAVTVRYYIGA